jgi:hypothetical protein
VTSRDLHPHAGRILCPAQGARRSFIARGAAALGITALALAGNTAAAELRYVEEIRGQSAASSSDPRLIVSVSPKIDLVLLAALRSSAGPGGGASGQKEEGLGDWWRNQARAAGGDAVARHLEALRSKGLWGDLLLEFALHLSEPPALDRLLPWSEALLAPAAKLAPEDPAGDLDKLRLELKAYAEAIKFEERYNQRKSDHERLEAEMRELIQRRDPVQVNARFWGTAAPGDFYLLPSPLVQGGFLASLEFKGRTHTFLAFGPGRPATARESRLLHHLLHHELSHPLIDPLLKEKSADLASSEALWKVARSYLGEMSGIESWEECVVEHLLRAYNIHDLSSGDPVMAELMVGSETAAGFLFTRSFVEMLAEYAAARSRWPDLEAYLPQITDRLARQAKRSFEVAPESRIPALDLTSGGFEETRPGWWIAGWDLVDGGEIPNRLEPRTSRVERVTDVAHTGSASLRLDVTSTTTDVTAVEQGPISMRPGGTVRLSGWVKARDVARQGLQQKVCGFYILFLDAKDQVLSRAETDSVEGTLDWTKLSGEFTAPAGTTRLQVGVLLAMTGTAWVDDVSLERLD